MPSARLVVLVFIATSPPGSIRASRRLVWRCVMRALPGDCRLSLGAAPAGAQPADLILLNGRVYTLDARAPWAEALAIAGERIAAVGTTAEVRKRAGAGDARDRPAGRVRLARLQRRPRARGRHGRAARGRQPARRARRAAACRARARCGGAAAPGELDRPGRLGRVRAVGRRLRGSRERRPPRPAPSCPTAG